MRTKLENAVIRRIGGKDRLYDVSRSGADAGWPGFCYYTDTTKFFRTHKRDIIAMAEDLARDLGENVLEMIAGFRCLNKDFSTEEVARVLYGPWKDDDAHTMIGNAMSWFALETVAHNLSEDK